MILTRYARIAPRALQNTLSHFPSRLISNQSSKAFVFDIDGVLLRGNKPIPQAHQALTLLNQEKVPFILLTNGGGVSEEARVEFLSDKLNIDISPLQIVQSHTPMRAWAQSGKFSRVMVVGGAQDKARQAALNYGFKDVVVPMDIVRQDPSVAPHHQYTDDALAKYAQDVDLSKPIDVILVFNDPRDMGSDIQIVCDLLNSENGVVGTLRTPPQSAKTRPAIPIVFSNNDYLWANDYNLPRFGQGAFRMMVERLYAETNRLSYPETLELTILGKPFKVQYDYAHWVLIEWNKILHGHKKHAFMPKLHDSPTELPFNKIFMVGDNPESDIHGANANGWESILLRTGVYKDADWDRTSHRPSVGVFDNVLDSVVEVLEVEA
ncbi:HAD-superfamily hydrolase [Metschnikowia bicuspidata var. bicuspidata NRRL YB-4993]|uniref:HAD-superfamily hydrolase n=1 Tax=Metschnikowia bicuspidata var. bicuspidata NRRL YB-4993 TaxID=869754 RepID=A0A1A0HDX3_9ASCO|nr:HAD-superfamily hydrolase [Metschnikowia bicuspidata var. bicuspidata NRRL YB-4993]OBA22180.1 HAD-superfamily hydrolase [Metschnikowia bicuspidata var. bicuspidata NRRL YB-4993]